MSDPATVTMGQIVDHIDHICQLAGNTNHARLNDESIHALIDQARATGDAALVLVPAFLLVTAGFEYLEVDSLGRDPQAFCDAYIDEVGGFCVDFADVNDRVYFGDDISGSASLVYWGGTILHLVVVQGLTGRTLGKLLTGIRTVREDGRPPGLVKAFLRWIMWVADAFPYVIPLLGPIVAGTTQTA